VEAYLHRLVVDSDSKVSVGFSVVCAFDRGQSWRVNQTLFGVNILLFSFSRELSTSIFVIKIRSLYCPNSGK